MIWQTHLNEHVTWDVNWISEIWFVSSIKFSSWSVNRISRRISRSASSSILYITSLLLWAMFSSIQISVCISFSYSGRIIPLKTDEATKLYSYLRTGSCKLIFSVLFHMSWIHEWFRWVPINIYPCAGFQMETEKYQTTVPLPSIQIIGWMNNDGSIHHLCSTWYTTPAYTYAINDKDNTRRWMRRQDPRLILAGKFYGKSH